MTVEFTPKAKGCFSFGAPNKHFFEFISFPGVKKILGDLPLTNDPLDIDRETAIKLGDYIQDNIKGELAQWAEKVDAGMYREFFEDCGGFTTF